MQDWLAQKTMIPGKGRMIRFLSFAVLLLVVGSRKQDSDSVDGKSTLQHVFGYYHRVFVEQALRDEHL